MRLGALIKALEEFNADAGVEFDFGYMRPTTLDSWRGDYAELALGYEMPGYANVPTVASLLNECRAAVGKEFYGWKGGDFLMDEKTEVHVDNPGDYSSTRLLAVSDIWGTVTLVTAKVPS